MFWLPSFFFLFLRGSSFDIVFGLQLQLWFEITQFFFFLFTFFALIIAGDSFLDACWKPRWFDSQQKLAVSWLSLWSNGKNHQLVNMARVNCHSVKTIMVLWNVCPFSFLRYAFDFSTIHRTIAIHLFLHAFFFMFFFSCVFFLNRFSFNPLNLSIFAAPVAAQSSRLGNFFLIRIFFSPTIFFFFYLFFFSFILSSAVFNFFFTSSFQIK